MPQHTPEYLSQVQPASAKPTDGDKLDHLQAFAAEARNLELEVLRLSEQLAETQAKLRNAYTDTFPSLLQELKLDHIGLAKDGNKPGMDFRLKTNYAANIAAGWPPEKREAGFALVTKLKAEDMIKTEVSVLFPKGGLKAAQKLLKQIAKIKLKTKVGKKVVTTKLKPELTKTIPHGTLSAWLKELVEKHHKMLSPQDLEKIGGYIGQIVKPEIRKE